MRITLSGAMRARDVSRPTDEQLAAAAEREALVGRLSGARGGGVVRGASGPHGARSSPGLKGTGSAEERDGLPAAALASTSIDPTANLAPDLAPDPTPTDPTRSDPTRSDPVTSDEPTSPTRRRRVRRR